MFFAAWYTFWVVFSTSTMALAYPGLALVTRSAYLNRSFLRWGYLLLATAIFLWLSVISQVTWGDAALRALKVLAFLLLTAHLISGVTEAKLQKVPFTLAIIHHMAGRYVRIIKERLEDIYYAARVRFSAPNVSLISKFKICAAACLSIIVECVVLAKQIAMIINARGELTHPREWRSVQIIKSHYLLGDAALLFLAITLALIGPEQIIPQIMNETLNFVKTALLI